MRHGFVIVMLVFAAGCHKQAPLEKPVTPVKVVAVDLYQPNAGARYSASIVPGRQVSLAFRVSGVVTDIQRKGGRGLDPGDVVRAGTVLARLRAEEYRHTAAQAQSHLETAKQNQRSAAAHLAQTHSSYSKSEADFARARALFESQSLTKPDFDAARAQLDAATAQVEAARAQLDGSAAQIRNAEAAVAAARLAESDAALISPFTASVVQRNIEVGMLAGPSVVAYSLAGIDTVKAVFGVPDTVVVQLRPGQKITIRVEALPAQEFTGTITSIASVADSETRLFQVEVTIANPQMLLKPGTIASLTLRDGQTQPAVPVIPLTAVVRDRSNASDFSVMVVEGKVAKARRIALGSTFGDLLAVTRGLQPGEKVIRAGGTLVRDGETVEVIP
jgi:multidrug efflux pump subunit AcrA (membrane-fusion protein)